MSPKLVEGAITFMRLMTQWCCGFAASVFLVTIPCLADHDDATFLQKLHDIKTIGSTVPTNGDVNPYGIAVVPITSGALVKDDILVSNFNNSSNLQGTGTTIDEIDASGRIAVFAALDLASLPGPCPGGIGLTTALVALRSGFVVVGSLPT